MMKFKIKKNICYYVMLKKSRPCEQQASSIKSHGYKSRKRVKTVMVKTKIMHFKINHFSK